MARARGELGLGHRMVKFDVIIILRDLVVLIVVFERRAPVLPLAEASRTLVVVVVEVR